MAFLERFDAELLLGQVSYKQKSDIYNFYNKYEKTQKKCQTMATSACDSDDDDDCRYAILMLTVCYLHSSTRSLGMSCSPTIIIIGGLYSNTFININESLK